MAHVYGQDWYQLLKKYGGQDPGPMPFQGRSLVPVGTPSDPVGAPPASSAVAVASPGVVKAPAGEPEAVDQQVPAAADPAWPRGGAQEHGAKATDQGGQRWGPVSWRAGSQRTPSAKGSIRHWAGAPSGRTLRWLSQGSA